MFKLLNLLQDQRGATAIEYGVLGGILGIGLISIMTVHNNALRNAFTSISNNLSAVPGLS